MAKGNDGNYLQHCIEVEAATRLAQSEPNGRLHIALTHGMKPFEEFERPNGAASSILCDSIREASCDKPHLDERKIVTAYRKTQASKDHYPNSAELLKAVLGKDRLSGGITEENEDRHKELAKTWSGTGLKAIRSSWREQLGADGALRCPGDLRTPWLFSMDPMTYRENGCDDDDNLYRADSCRLEDTLRQYFRSGQPGIACLFVYNMGLQGNNPQQQFWAFMGDLARRLGMHTGSYWVAHRGGNLNLAGLLFSTIELCFGFVPPTIKPGRGRQIR